MIKISASFSKRIPGDQPYSSDAVHLGVEVELPDRLLSDQEQFSQAVRRLFAQARAEVEHQVAAPSSNGSASGNPNGNGRHADNGRTNGSAQPASPRQIDYVLSLGRRNANMSPAEKLTDLTKSQASELIDRFSEARQ